MKTKTSRNILVFLLTFLALSAIGGGGSLIVSPSGKLSSWNNIIHHFFGVMD
ncbi:MAG: hypothetical protein ACOYMD_06805 [Paludibacter sp.]